jgi:tetratricopeptide (TPR) repeat protein
MKKVFLLMAMASFASIARAQKSNIGKAMIFLNANNYKSATPLVDDAVKNSETKNDPDAWYWRGMTYLQMALDSTTKSPSAVQEASRSFEKTLSLKPDFGVEIDNSVYTTSILCFNKGVEFYQNQQYSAAYEYFMKIAALYNAGGGKRFLVNSAFTELVTSAKTNAAYAAQAQIEIYQKQNKDAELIALIKESRKQFPDNKTFRDLELNYYISSGKQAELFPLLENAVKQDPNNPDLLFNLANAYTNAAFPKDVNGSSLPAPADFKDVFTKAENAYKKAIKVKPDNEDYNYNLGTLYYSNASTFNRQMNDVKGTSPAENAKYDELVAMRNAEFSKAQPYFEKAYTFLDFKSGSLSNEDKATYRNVMIGLREIYSRTNNKDKAVELKKKLDELK